MSDVKVKTKIVVVIDSMNVEYAYETLAGIKKEAEKNNADLYIFNSNSTTDETIKHNVGEYNIYRLINFDEFDGVILFANLIQGYSVYNYIIDKIRKSGLPTVSIDADLEGFYYVGVENYEPMKALVSHLIEKHHYTDLAIFAGQDFNTDNQERVLGFLDACREHNITIKENRIFKGAFANIYGREFAKKLLENKSDLPQAVVCCTDNIAFGARTVFENNGIRMPEDIALTGFDDIFEAGNTIPRLTSISRNLDVVGGKAVERIFDHINGRTVKIKERFKATPVYRESCGCDPKDKGDIITLKKKYLETSEMYINYLIISNTLMDTLTDCDSYEDFKKKLIPFVKKTFSGEFFLCLDNKFIDELTGYEDVQEEINYNKEGYPAQMRVALHIKAGRVEREFNFKTAKMLPKEGKNNKVNNYVFSPLHFRDRCMGYAVIDETDVKKMGPIFNTWFINLCNCFESLRKQVHLKNAVEYLDKQYVIDPLTEIYNRYGFDRFTHDGFERCKNNEETFMLLFSDMDGLKKINDEYGHDMGDLAIKAVANALKDSCLKGEICARYGGDEFVVYGEKYTDADANAFIEKFNEKLKETQKNLNFPYPLKASCGYIIAIPDDGEIIKNYIDMADNCMYAQKLKHKQNIQNQ